MPESAEQHIHEEKAAYTGGEERPLGSFTTIMGIYAGTVAAGAAAVRASGATLPETVGTRDLALISLATFRLSRLLAKDPVTSPLRAPFTRFEGTSGEAELAEQVRGAGPRKAIGELVTCPFCVGQWIATGFAFGLVLAPRATRLAAATITAVAAADWLQFAYSKTDQAATG